MGCGASTASSSKYESLEKGGNDGSGRAFQMLYINKQPIDTFYEMDPVTLGTGGFGSVKRATRRGVDGDKVDIRAIKQLCRKQTNKTEFKDEITIAHQLDHPNIIKLYEIFEDARAYYLVMEICSGGDLLDAIMAAKQPFTERQAGTIMHQILRGIAYMHNNFVCHRDIKPENFLLQSDGALDTCTIKIIDFGLAARFEAGVKMAQAVGSFYYMSPQVLKKSYTEKTDVWSCGVVMYILLSGKVPFPGRTNAEICETIRQGRYSFPDNPWKRTTAEAKDFIKEMLAYAEPKRLKAEQALVNKWIEGRDDANRGSIVLEGEHLASLKDFAGQNKLKKAALHIVAQGMCEEDIIGLKELFVSLDKNQDGLVSLEELKDGAKKLGDNNSTVVGSLEELIRGLDCNDSSTIDYTEFIAATLSKRAYQERGVLWSAFRAFDRDGSGKISQRELTQVLNSKDVAATFGASLQQVMTDIDVDGDGEIDFDEFMGMMQSGAKSETQARKSKSVEQPGMS